MPKVRQHGDGGLYKITRKRKDGSPYTLWRGVIDMGFTVDGKRDQRTVHARTQRACKDKLDELKDEIRDHGAPLQKNVTVQQWSKKWLELIVHDVDPKTYTGYAGMVKNWIVPTIGTKRVASLKPSDVTAVRTATRDAGRSTSTARQAHIVLSMMLDAARVEKLCRGNVAKDVRKPGAKGIVVKVERAALTTEQTIAILRAAADLEDAAGARWWFKILTGQRQGEILGARLEDVDLDAGLWTVSWKLESLTYDHGCGDEPCGYKWGSRCPQKRLRIPDDFEYERIDDRWHFTRPKSKTGRVVPIVTPLAEALTRWLDSIAERPNPHGLLFPDAAGMPVLPKDDGQQWRELLAAAKVITPEQAVPGGTELTGHWARHTVVTVLASLGVDHQLIGEIVGHSSTKVTEMYRHAQAAEKRAAMDMLGTAWGEALGLPNAGEPRELGAAG